MHRTKKNHMLGERTVFSSPRFFFGPSKGISRKNFPALRAKIHTRVWPGTPPAPWPGGLQRRQAPPNLGQLDDSKDKSGVGTKYLILGDFLQTETCEWPAHQADAKLTEFK